MAPSLSFHHTGVAVHDMDAALRFYERVFGFSQKSEVVTDEGLGVKVCLIALPPHTESFIELVSPLGPKSPVQSYLSRGMTYYHHCYVVTDLAEAVRTMCAEGMVQVVPPTPAKLFGGREVSFLSSRTSGLVELLAAG